MLRASALLLCLAAAAGHAQEMTSSPRPQPKPMAVAAAGPAEPAEPGEVTSPATGTAKAGTVASVLALLRPKARPTALVGGNPTPASAAQGPAEVAEAPEAALAPAGSMGSSLRPEPRPRKLVERIAVLKAKAPAAGLDLSSNPDGADADLAAVAPPSAAEQRRKKREAASLKGSVCGVAAIKGEKIRRISSKVKGCGVEDPVAVTSIAGVRLSQTATVDCSIATALNSWVDEVAQPAFDGKLVELQVAAHYICRSRNNVKGARISEHGKGRAIDVSGFVLSNGSVLTVQDNYNKLLRGIYKAACPYFRTTLGPGSDGYHENHFHFDTSARSGGSYCR